MIIISAYNLESVNYFNKIKDKLPKSIQSLVAETKIELFNKTNTINYNQNYIPEGHTATINTLSCFSPSNNTVYLGKNSLYGNFCDEPASFNTILHELGHALDYKLNWISNRIKNLGINLDEYAAINPKEQFAQCFEAYFRGENKPTKIYCEYTIKELKEKAPEYLSLFNHLSVYKELNI